MIYRSNLIVPDLSPNFHMVSKVRNWSMGHDVPSDPDFEPDCGFLTHDEAAILHHCAKNMTGLWIDIGARFMWCVAHIAAAGRDVLAVDPGYSDKQFKKRALANIGTMDHKAATFALTSEVFFGHCAPKASGFFIDGNHDAPEPLKDARSALNGAFHNCAMVFHDFWGQPIRDGVRFLMAQGLKCRTYDTPNGMAVCWRGDFIPPMHVPDPAINWAVVRNYRAPEFDFARCS